MQALASIASSYLLLLLPASPSASVVWAMTCSAQLAAGCAAACWLGAVLTGYWSYVDRLWSLVPCAYAAIFAASHLGSERVFVMCLCSALWSLRLTYNFARKGGYGAEEDYRWPILRSWFARNDPMHPLGRELFSLLFVAMCVGVAGCASGALASSPRAGGWRAARAPHSPHAAG